jgi:hypothetical protein
MVFPLKVVDLSLNTRLRKFLVRNLQNSPGIRNRDHTLNTLGLSSAGNLVKPLLTLYGTEWRERGYGLGIQSRIRNQQFPGHTTCT